MTSSISNFLVAILSLCSLAAFGQSEVSSARQYINELHEGTLVVRLYMNQNKTDYLTDLATSDSGKVKAKAQKLLDEHLAERQTYVTILMEELKANYNFSEVVYLPDYNMKAFLAGERQGIFFNENGKVDPAITMKSDKGLMAVRVDRDDVLLLTALDGTQLPKAFPARPKVSFFKALLRFARNHLRDNVISLNSGLQEFYKI